jgi:hypothetical protein
MAPPEVGVEALSPPSLDVGLIVLALAGLSGFGKSR